MVENIIGVSDLPPQYLRSNQRTSSKLRKQYRKRTLQFMNLNKSFDQVFNITEDLHTEAWYYLHDKYKEFNEYAHNIQNFRTNEKHIDPTEFEMIRASLKLKDTSRIKLKLNDGLLIIKPEE